MKADKNGLMLDDDGDPITAMLIGQKEGDAPGTGRATFLVEGFVVDRETYELHLKTRQIEALEAQVDGSSDAADFIKLIAGATPAAAPPTPTPATAPPRPPGPRNLPGAP